MKIETEIMKKEFIKRTKIIPLKFRLQTGSMKHLISVEIKGNKEDYKRLNESRFIGDIKITFIQDFSYFNNPKINLDIPIMEFKSIDWNKIKILNSLK